MKSAVIQMPNMNQLLYGPRGGYGDPGVSEDAAASAILSLQDENQRLRAQVNAQQQAQAAQQAAQAAQAAQQARKPGIVRMPFFPTAPFYATGAGVGYQTRFYGSTLRSTETDYVVGSEALRIVQFDMPCTIVAINGSAYNSAGTGFPLGVTALDTFLFRVEYSTGDKLMTAARLASTCIGNQQNPGEIGGVGYIIQPGASVVLGITPLYASLRIDVTLVCLEARGPTNYTNTPIGG